MGVVGHGECQGQQFRLAGPQLGVGSGLQRSDCGEHGTSVVVGRWWAREHRAPATAPGPHLRALVAGRGVQAQAAPAKQSKEVTPVLLQVNGRLSKRNRK